MSTPAVPEIDVHEAARRAETGEVLLIDVREDDEWAAGRAASATHLSLSSLHLEDVPTARPVFVICRSGHRSGKAVTALLAAGVQATNVVGGMLAWDAAGLPIVADDGVRGVVS